MAAACAWSVALVGLEGRIVEVEADIGAGLPRWYWWASPTRPSIRRVIAARRRSATPGKVADLAADHQPQPGYLPKAGSHYDLAIVAAMLAAQGIFRAEELRRTALLGEVGLDGRLRPVRGVLPATLAAQQAVSPG